MNRNEFLKLAGITERQFLGIEPIEGDLYLSYTGLKSLPDGFNPTVGGSLSLDNNNITSLPDGFNPTVGGSLYLHGNNLTILPESFNPTMGGSLYLHGNNLTILPESFNPTMGGSLYLHSNNLTSLPDGFNPTVGGSLYLDNNNLTSLPDGFNPTVGGGLSLDNNNLTSLPEYLKNYKSKELPIITWGERYVKCDGRFSEVISKKGNVWKLRDINKTEEYYLVTDGNGKFAHGETVKQAKEDLVYKLSSRDTSRYQGIDTSKQLPFAYCIEMYRSITGACATGVKNFIETKGIKKGSFSVMNIAEITKGSYGNETFKSFFKIK